MEDLTGKTMGTWEIIRFSHIREDHVKHGTRNRRFWNVRCINCGHERVAEKHNMVPPSGGRCQKCWGRKRGETGCNELYDTYIRNARNYEREFSLTMEEFAYITSSSCHYCGVEPIQVKELKSESTWSTYFYNGIDRVDNDMGYVSGNCIPCCVVCNRAKNDMSYDNFMQYINRIKNKE